jgi:hypothetical protein
VSKQEGWQVSAEAGVKVIFCKNNSTCYIRNREDFKSHLFSRCLTSLEYFEGIEFWNSNKKEIQHA